MRKLLPAVVFSLALLGVAPFMGELRQVVETTTAGRYLLVAGAGFAAVVLAALGWAVWSIRQQRWLRYGLLAAGTALMLLQLFVFSRDDPRVNAVERIHFLFYGALAFLLLRATRQRRDATALPLALLAGAGVGLLDEWVQWLVPVRTGELADVLLNAYATFCGLFIAVALRGTESLARRPSRASLRLLGATVAVLAVLVGGFLESAHLGYQIDDPEIGRFRSYFTDERLAELSERYRAQWARRPPPPMAPLQKENYYLTEGGWRVQHRNHNIHQQPNPWVAWKENQILEKYWGPYLDLEREGGTTRRLPPALRQRLDREGPAGDRRIYESPVGREPHRIFLRPTSRQLWLAIAIVVALAALLPRLAPRGPTKRHNRQFTKGESKWSDM